MTSSREELSNMHWRDRWDFEAEREFERQSSLSEQELIDRVRNRDLGNYYQIWKAIGNVGSVDNSAMVLWDFLQQTPGDDNMLHRYHCAGALFKIIGMPDPECTNELRRQVQWDHSGEDTRQEALMKLRDLIGEKSECT